MKRKVFFIPSVGLALFFFTSAVISQSLPLKHYSKKDGLASSFVTCILQDSHGFLWFGTEHGLSRFDGSKFQNFLAGGAQGLKNDYITSLLEDHLGSLWIGTKGGGLACLNSGKIKTYTTREGLPSDFILSIFKDPEENLWLGTFAGISKFNGKGFTNYSTKDGLAGDLIKKITSDDKGNLWIGTENGISCITKRKGNIRIVNYNYTQNNGLISNEINTLMMDYKGNVWIGTKEGLNCYQKEKSTFISYSTKDGMANDFVNSLLESKDNNIWIGTNRGVSFFSPSSGKFTKYDTKNGFLHDDIFTIFEDNEGNIWFGTRKGISRLHSLRIINFSVNDGLPDNYIWAVIEEKKGKYWIGTDKGLSCYSNGAFKTYTTRDGLINDSILNLLKDRSGNLWIATNGGLTVYSPGSATFTNYSVSDGLPSETVLSIEEDIDSTMWIGTGRGLCHFKNGSIIPPNFSFKLEPSAIHAILKDSRDNLWFSDTKVLWKISGMKSRYYSDRDGLVYGEIYSLFEDSRERIWIGTKGGVSCFSNGRFINYSITDGISDNNVLFVLEDNNQNIWLGTVNGLNRYDGKSFKTYTSRDGLISNEMSHSTCLKDTGGNLWFCTVNGLTRFNPRLDRVNTVPPPVYITQLEVMGKPHPLSNIRLKHDEGYLKFDFIGLCYTSPEDVVYKYRLEGTDTHWFETRDPYISYPSLNPGTYVFKVIAKNNDGIESLKPAEIRFKILPPFWQTWWFKALLALVILTMVVIFILLQNKRLKARVANEENKKQLVMAQRMKLMGVLAGGAVHDLKNLLSIIIGYSNLVHDYGNEVDEEEKNEAFAIIKSTADTAFQVVKQILAFTRQTEDETKPTNPSESLGEILTILKITIPPTLKILWVPPKEEITLYINPIKFKQVVMNVCLNAVQAMGENGVLKIVLAMDPLRTDRLCIEVSDTGPGIPRHHLNKIFDPLFTTKEEEKGSGLGLFVVKQIVDEYKGEIRVDTQEGEGASFKIYFPVQPPPVSDKN